MVFKVQVQKDEGRKKLILDGKKHQSNQEMCHMRSIGKVKSTSVDHLLSTVPSFGMQDSLEFKTTVCG